MPDKTYEAYACIFNFDTAPEVGDKVEYQLSPIGVKVDEVIPKESEPATPEEKRKPTVRIKR